MSHNTPENLKYTKEHEWTLIEGDTAIIGVTDFAQSSLGEVVFIEFPEVGTTLDKDGTFGVIESIKSVSDLYSPISGEVLEVNSAIGDTPEKINENPYESWLVKMKITNTSEISELMEASAYSEFCESH
jgi:glycine cleavage system H protein